MHRDRRLDERGYALMLVLGVMGLTFLSSVALLGLALTSSRLTVAQTQAAEEQRAADGALEAAATRLAASSEATACAGLSTGATVDFVGATGATVPVVVDCRPGTTDPNRVDLPLGGPGVEVVGTAEPAGDLVHRGIDPLPFDADVTVRTGADAVVDPAGPAVTATGQYQQGRAGPGATGTGCGGLATPGNRQVRDRNDVPECGVSVTSPVPVAQELVAPGTQPVANVPACATVVSLQPGYYPPAAVSALNALVATCNGATIWFQPAAVGAGVYEFDANDPTNSVVARRNAVVFDNPTVSVVVGVPRGWNPATGGASAAFPMPCDPTRSGASIQLSGRTAIKHLAGRFAVCPALAASGTPLPAIVQTRSARLQPDGTMVSSEFTRNTPANPQGNVLDRTVRATGYFFPCTFLDTQCRVDRTAVTTWRDLPDVPLTSARLNFRSRETPPVFPTGASRRVDLTITRADGTSLATCGFDFGRTHQQVTSIDLLGPGCSGLSGQQATALEGSRFSARFRYTNPQCFTSPVQCVTLEVWDMRLEVNSSVATAQTVASGSSWATEFPATNVLADDAALTRPNQSFLCTPDDARCRRDQPGTERSVTIQDLRFPAGSALSSAATPIDDLAVVIRNNAAGVANGSYVSDPIDQTSVTARLTLQDGRECSVVAPGFANSFQAQRIDLSDGCADVVGTAGDVTDADLTLTYRSDCLWYGAYRAAVAGSPPRCDTVRIPNLQFVGVVATTDQIQVDPPPSEVTVDVTGVGGRVAEFHAFGGASMPTAELQLHWRGTARSATASADTSLFGGSLVVRRLASDSSATARTGVVCCTPAGAPVRLTASVGGRVRATAVLEVLPPVVSGPRPVRVLDWRVGG